MNSIISRFFVLSEWFVTIVLSLLCGYRSNIGRRARVRLRLALASGLSIFSFINQVFFYLDRLILVVFVVEYFAA